VDKYWLFCVAGTATAKLDCFFGNTGVDKTQSQIIGGDIK